MQLAATKTFSVHFPSVYDHILTLKESIMGEHRSDDKCLSYISISLEELNFYDEYEGNDLTARFRESCFDQRGAVEVIADKTLSVAGRLSGIRTAQSPDGQFYYFGLIPVNDEYGYSFTGDCEIGSREFYEPMFDEIWQSLKHFADDAVPVQEQPAINAVSSNTLPDKTKRDNALSTPADGQEYWHIGKHQFTLTGETQCHISDGDGALYVKIEALAPDYIDLQENDIISSYNDRKVYLQFYFKGIYHAGVPTGKFHFKKERNDSDLTYLWKGGFQYSQSLSAEVILKDGWLSINGSFNQYPVRIAVRLTDFSWENYRFLSTQEVSTAAPEIVQQLWLTDPKSGDLQETIRPLKQLQVLWIYFRDSKQAADFKEVPEAVKDLKELKALSLTGVSALESLPQWLGDLQKLETIRLEDSKVTAIHPHILQLPVLTKLYLGSNQLQAIPPTLPEHLETLVLSNNELTTVPDTVVRLQYLNIERNPLQQLPAGLENIPQLSLELQKKMTLLDYRYKGADGQGTVPYDDKRFYAKYDPALSGLLEKEISAAGLAHFKEGLTNRARKSLALETTEEDTYADKGNHRFGGLPDLPPGMAYPTFIDWYGAERGLQFIAQINCAAVAHLQDYLPRTGILYFFVKDLEETDPRVLYYDGDNSDLQSAKDLHIDPDFIYEQHGIYTPFRASVGTYPDIPPMYDTLSLYPELTEMEDMNDETVVLRNALKGSLGDTFHSVNTFVFKQHGTPEMDAVDAKKGKQEDWMVLLKVSSDNKTGFHFRDAGEIYFVIHKSDLEKKDFSNVYFGLESS